jgi:hypothetical protein
MLIVNGRSFYTGLSMAAGFGVVLVLLFLPIVRGRTPLAAADDLFNSVAKQSSYFIPELRKHASAHRGMLLDMRLTLPDADAAAKAAEVLGADGIEASATGAVVALRGDLGHLLGAALEDADEMFGNRAGAAGGGHGLGAREAMFARWQALKQLSRQLRTANEFEKASAVEEVITKGLEVSYNFYGITPSPGSAHAGVLGMALVFYLLYTVWWGYAIMWLSDGIGLQMKASGRREH